MRLKVNINYNMEIILNFKSEKENQIAIIWMIDLLGSLLISMLFFSFCFLSTKDIFSLDKS